MPVLKHVRAMSPYWMVPAHFLFLFLLGAAGEYLHILNFKWETIAQSIWDPGWYSSIRSGYYYSETGQSNVAFFPLFPLVWRWLGVDEWGICIFNFLLLLVSLTWLVKEYKLTKTEALITSSSAGLFYCWLGYSESVFLFTATILLVGYKRNNQWLILSGLFLASLTRSAAVVFIPAATAVVVFKWLYTSESKTKIIKAYSGWLLACIAAVAVVVVIQWHDTGLWMVFGKAQEMWNKKFQFPNIPLTSWGNFRILFFDAAALIVGGLAGFILLGFLLRKKDNTTAPISSDYVFTLTYLCTITVVSLLFGVQGEHNTCIFSLNRYIFCTAFFLVFVIYHLRSQTFSYAEWALWVCAGIAGIWLTGYFGNPYDENQLSPARMDAVAIVLFFAAFYLLKKYRHPLFYLLVYLYQAGLQLHFLDMYLKGYWVG